MLEDVRHIVVKWVTPDGRHVVQEYHPRDIHKALDHEKALWRDSLHGKEGEKPTNVSLELALARDVGPRPTHTDLPAKERQKQWA